MLSDKKIEYLASRLKKIAPTKQNLDSGLAILQSKLRQSSDALLTPAKVSLTEKLSELASGVYDFVRRGLSFYTSHLVIGMAVIILLFGGVGAWAGYSARQALPDQGPLYTLKRTLETTQITLSLSSSKKAQMRVNFLERRVDELNKVVRKAQEEPVADTTVITQAVKNAQSGVLAVKESLTDLAKAKVNGDVDTLVKLLDEKMAHYKLALEETGKTLPESLRASIAAEVSQLSDVLQNLTNDLDRETGLVEGASTASSTDMTLLGSVVATSTAETTTTEALVRPTVKSVEIQQPGLIPETQISIEEDTFEVRIGY